MSKESLATANVTSLDRFMNIIAARIAKTAGGGKLFANAEYTESDSGYDLTSTYSRAAFDDSAKTYARVCGSRTAFSMDTSVFDPTLLGIPAPATSADSIDLSSATVTLTVNSPGKLYRFSKPGATCSISLRSV